MAAVFATVTQVTPPKVRLDGDSVAVPVLTFGATVTVGQRVRVEPRPKGLPPVLAGA